MRRQQGLTLVELLVTMAIAGILLSVLGALFSSSLKARQVQNELTELENNVALVTQLLQSELRLTGFKGDDAALSVNIAATAGNSTWTTSAPPISVAAPASQDAPRIIYVQSISGGNPNFLKVAFSRNGTQLERHSWGPVAAILPAPPVFLGTGTTQVVADGVEDLQVFYLKKNLVNPAPDVVAALPDLDQLVGLQAYLRLRVPSLQSTCGTWPVMFTSAQMTQRGISAKTYSGSDCRYRRKEVLLTVYPASSLK